MTTEASGQGRGVADGESAALASVSAPAVGAASAVVDPPEGAATTDSSPVESRAVDSRSFLRRHRLPLALGFIALCLYAGSIVYILFGRGQLT